MTHAELRLQLLLALCTGHVDVPDITDPRDLGDFLFQVADRMARNIAAMTADEADKR